MTGNSDSVCGGWRGLARAARSFMPILAVCSLWALVVILDVVVMRSRCAEGSLVEWTQFLLVAASGAMMVALAVRSPRACGAFVLAAAFFFDMAIREQDGLLDSLLWHGSWAAIVAMVTVAAFSIAFAKRCRTTVLSGLSEMTASRSFLLLAVGLAIILGISRVMGMKFLWCAFGSMSELSYAKRIVEESLELLGYGLVFAWALGFSLERRVPAGSREAAS